jgi:class 3 adenylate cyclase
VTIAAALAAKAEGGQILSSSVVRELAAGKGFQFVERADALIDGADGAIRVYQLEWREAVAQ